MTNGNAKAITIAVAGAGDKKEYKDVQILPGTQARDVLRQLDLAGMALSKPEGGVFAMADNLYDAIAEGQKLYATKSNLSAGVR